MKKNKTYILSAGDINSFLNCKHKTQLDTQVANKTLKKPDFKNPHTKVMQERGFEHEASYIEHLKTQGHTPQAATVEDNESAYDKTIQLMEQGADIITQGVLQLDQWYGRSDLLLKVNRPSKLGDYSYVVLDTKLSRDTKSGTIMQLCLYSEMVEAIQGVMPEEMYVVTPGEEGDFNKEEYRVHDYQAYYRLVRNKLLQSLDKIEAYPEPVSHCDICHWWERCNKRRRDDDHLSLIANINKSQRKALEEIKISSMKDFAELDPADFTKLPHGTNIKSMELSQKQAQIQVKARETGERLTEFMPFEDGRGLSRLPEPDDGDIFFDIEGDTFVGRHGLEYLLGVTYLENKELQYKGIWATAPKMERTAFIELMTFILDRIKTHPKLHIYHYAGYETGAVKRLAQRYGVFEQEVDGLLRSQKFVDLYSVVRQGIRASLEKYSIKDLEQFTEYERKIPLNDMIVHKRALEHNLELSRYDDINEEMKDAVMLYNQDDTDSTYFLREWLEEKRREAISSGQELLRPEEISDTASDEISERDQTLQQIKDDLTKDIDFDGELSTEEQARVLLGDLASFYRREEKVAYWELFRLKDMNEAELLEDKSGIAGLNLDERIPPSGRGKINTDVYSYPVQEVDFRSKDDIYQCGGEKLGKLEEHNPYDRILKIKKTKVSNDITADAVFRFSLISSKALEDRSVGTCQEIIDNGMDDPSNKAIKDILLRRPPDSSESIEVPEGVSALDHAYKVVLGLNRSYLPIQGPPGAGKSYTGSHLIQFLLENGKKVGVCAISHKVINGLLSSTHKLVGDKFEIIHKVSDKNADYSYKVAFKAAECHTLASGDKPCVIGGTSWLFAHPDMNERLDYLFIDEGGQLSLANLLSISSAAKNLVILGDCQQLEQPIQADHPEGADLSALEYIQGDHATIPKDRGLFLDTTYRLHPEICKFNSELFYESRLTATDGNDGQVITGPTKIEPLMYREVSHKGNSNYSMEEVEAIYDLVMSLTENKHEYSLFNKKNMKLEKHTLALKDIMIVAPYNVQVQRLKDKLPDEVEIGTVDKFQGREAPLVIYSVTTSSPEDAPRGMGFLYSQSRLNVASSRAQCSFIMVACREIFEANCKSPGQMKLANAYCRFLEMSGVLKK